MRSRTTKLILAAVFAVTLKAQTCQPAVTNDNCSIELDREAIVKPLTIQAKPRAIVTVRIAKRPLERIIFESEYRDVERPDAGAALFQAMSGNLGSLVLSSAIAGAGAAPPAASALVVTPPSTPAALIRAEIARIRTRETDLEAALSLLRDAQQMPADQLDDWTSRQAGMWSVADFNAAKRQIQCEVQGTPADCASPGAAGRLVPSTRPVAEAIKAVVKRLNDNRASIAGADLTTIESDLSAVDEKFKSLEAAAGVLEQTRSSLVSAARKLALINHTSTYADPYLLRASVDDQNINSLGVGRCADTKVSSEDLLTKEKKLLLTLNSVCWGETRWEMSAGALFSTFPDRSFAAAPIIRDGRPVRADNDPTKDILTRLTESVTRPTVVPMALGHFRLAETSLAGRRLAVLLSGGVGVNPYNKGADFGAGFSLALRGLMLTPLVHFGRDQRLTQGLYVGQELGASPPALSTERYWVRRFGFAISYRIPIK